MQQRMKDFPMTPEAVTALLKRAAVGRISTIGADGYPYTVAVHFCWDGSAVYFHGLPRGEKLDNIARCQRNDRPSHRGHPHSLQGGHRL